MKGNIACDLAVLAVPDRLPPYALPFGVALSITGLVALIALPLIAAGGRRRERERGHGAHIGGPPSPIEQVAAEPPVVVRPASAVLRRYGPPRPFVSAAKLAADLPGPWVRRADLDPKSPDLTAAFAPRPDRRRPPPSPPRATFCVLLPGTLNGRVVPAGSSAEDRARWTDPGRLDLQILIGCCKAVNRRSHSERGFVVPTAALRRFAFEDVTVVGVSREWVRKAGAPVHVVPGTPGELDRAAGGPLDDGGLSELGAELRDLIGALRTRHVAIPSEPGGTDQVVTRPFALPGWGDRGWIVARGKLLVAGRGSAVPGQMVTGLDIGRSWICAQLRAEVPGYPLRIQYPEPPSGLIWSLSPRVTISVASPQRDGAHPGLLAELDDEDLRAFEVRVAIAEVDLAAEAARAASEGITAGDVIGSAAAIADALVLDAMAEGRSIARLVAARDGHGSEAIVQLVSNPRHWARSVMLAELMEALTVELGETPCRAIVPAGHEAGLSWWARFGFNPTGSSVYVLGMRAIELRRDV